MNAYAGMAIAALLPVLLTILFIFLEKKTYFNILPETGKQIIIGIFFGIVAIYGTERGIPYKGAAINVRDAAVLAAGLIFGAKAGIIAGLLGGIERYFSVYWGVGAYTQIACSISTTLAGFYSAALRKYLFDDYKPSWTISFFIGMVMEVFHMVMVFLTNMADAERAMEVVQICSVVMIPANAISTMLSAFVAQYFTNTLHNSKITPRISQTIQRWLLLAVALMFILTSAFTFAIQDSISNNQLKNQLKISIEDLAADVMDASDNNLLLLTYEISNVVGTYDLNEIATDYGVTEINLVDKDGKIFESTNQSFVGFSMNSGQQSAEFLCLLNGTKEFVQEYGPIVAVHNTYRKYAGIATDYGFLQVGYSSNEFQEDIANQVKIAANNKHVGTSGYIIIADEDFNVISAPHGHEHENIKQCGFDITAEPETVIEGVIDGVDSFYVYTGAEGYFIASIMSKAEATHSRNAAMYINTFMEILAFAVLFAMIYALIKKTVVDKIEDVNNSLAKITAGDLDEVVNVNSNQEFVRLSSDINQTVDRLKDYIAEANARIDSEIQYAKNIQESALPHVFPNTEKYEIFALMEAAKGVGGDFYDFFNTTRHGVNFLIADVSGKGIPGAMFMMRAKSELHALTETGIEVHDVFTYGNERLCEGNDAGMFVTAWQGCINLETGLIKYANAGHNPPVILRTDGTCEYVRGKAGFVLAGMEGIKYKDQELQMNPGDILFLYTDGVVEATNTNNELYGEERLLECLKNVDKSIGMDYLCCEVIGDVGRFVGEAEQFDDITMLALLYKGDNGDKLKPEKYTLNGTAQ